MPSSTVLVTGGTGFVGSYVAKNLVTAGDDVVAYDNDTDRGVLEKLDVAEQIEVVQGDITDLSSLLNTVRDYDIDHIVHLASFLTTGTRSNPRLALDVNITGTNNVFECARVLSDQIERVAWASSTAVYAPAGAYDHEWVAEEDLLAPNELYGGVKIVNERQCKVYNEQYDVSLVGLRPPVVFGPFRQSGASAFLSDIVERPALGRPYTGEYGSEEIHWLYVKDAAQAFVDALSVPDEELEYPAYNVGGEVLTVGEFADIVEEVTDVEVDVAPDGNVEWVEGQSVQNMKNDYSAATADLGYKPTYDVREAIVDYANSVRRDEGVDPIT